MNYIAGPRPLSLEKAACTVFAGTWEREWTAVPTLLWC